MIVFMLLSELRDSQSSNKKGRRKENHHHHPSDISKQLVEERKRKKSRLRKFCGRCSWEFWKDKSILVNLIEIYNFFSSFSLSWVFNGRFISYLKDVKKFLYSTHKLTFIIIEHLKVSDISQCYCHLKGKKLLLYTFFVSHSHQIRIESITKI